MHLKHSAILVFLTLLGSPAGAAQARSLAPDGGVLPLRHGIYVHDTVPCAGAPFAEMQDYRGDGIGSPHSRACHARIVAREAGTVTIVNSCLDAGEGPAKRVDERMTLRVERPDRYAMVVGGETFTYRWCEALPAGRR